MTVSAESLATAVRTAPGFAQLEHCPAISLPDEGEMEAILDQAIRFSKDILLPLRGPSDRIGCHLEEGRVITPPGYRQAWQAYVEGGFSMIELPADQGGLAMPRVLSLAVQEVMDRDCPAFGMLALSTRSAARLISAHGDEAVREEWVPPLVEGRWGATICISEPDAGSDVMRIRTRAALGEGGWRITGEKCWISFADQDLTDRIGHCVLARTDGSRGLSLFLVPDRLGDGRNNQVFMRRLEEKLGLHGSPTCVMGFEGSEALLLGEEGRGLAQMFTMITNMRLAVGAMGLGIAQGALEVALDYARDRRQGGDPSLPPVAIVEHADVRRMLLDIASSVELLRSLAFATAVQADLAEQADDAEVRDDARAVTAWLLPIVKTLGGEISFRAADTAIQVLGGAGYTREWPVEQALRDGRVLTIFEGTTGIQGLDLLHRRLGRDGGAPLRAFCSFARATVGKTHNPRLGAALDLLTASAERLTAADAKAGEAAATHFLHLAGEVACAWSALRLLECDECGSEDARKQALAEHWLVGLDERLACLAAQARPEPRLGDRFVRAFVAD